MNESYRTHRSLSEYLYTSFEIGGLGSIMISKVMVLFEQTFVI